MKLSIIVPSIRPQNLLTLYNSIDIKDFEMIVVSPFRSINLEFENIKNVQLFYSYRSPNACQQFALTQAKGDYVTFASDDGMFLPHVLNNAIEMLDDRIIDIVVGKYFEGENPNPDMAKSEYYQFKYHKTYRLKGVPQEQFIFNCGIISRKFIMELGGWDAENFECTTMAHADLGIRAIKAGVKMILMNEPMFKCSHQPGNSGDHRPINQAMKRDIKRFQKIYANPTNRTVIDINNWQKTPERWKERFKGKNT